MCICTGDLNINYLCKTTADYGFLMDLLNSFDPTQLINVPTRMTKTTKTALDLIITNRPDLAKSFDAIPCDPISTDHEAITLTQEP